MEHIKRVGRELMYKGSMLEFYKDTIVTPDGKTVYWDHIEHKGAAAVVAVRDDGRIIMVRQFRNSPDKETLEIPAGGINKGEPVKTAAIRELEEETGYKADPDNVRKLISIITAVAFCNEKVDRKSTRLNSSHTVISYAGFCLKKKKKSKAVCEGQEDEMHGYCV